MNSGKRKGLGRGLTALFGDQKSDEKSQKSNTVSYTHMTLPTNREV